MLGAFSWPNVRGKRCLVVGDHVTEIQDELERRGAEDIVVGTTGDPWPASAGALFDVCVGWGVGSRSESPSAAYRAVRSVTRGSFVSIEPVDLLLTVGARPIPVLRLLDGDGGRWYSMNGRAHHRLLGAAGFTVERPSKIVLVPGESPGLLLALVGRLLAGGGRGVAHRALIARAHP